MHVLKSLGHKNLKLLLGMRSSNKHLSGSPAKSGPLDFGTKNNFPSFFVSENGLVHIYKKPTYYFPVS